MKLQKIATAGLAVVAALTFAACSDNNDDGGTDPTSTASSAAQSSTSADPIHDGSQPPNAVALNTLLDEALNPQVPAAKKTELVQGSEADPKLFDKLISAKKQLNGVTYKLIPPVIASPTNKKLATVKASVKLPDAPQRTADASIIFDKGAWKLSKMTICPLLSAANIASPMCPTAK